jgi:ribosomal protein S18 acetylase RimI-like enzyme
MNNELLRATRSKNVDDLDTAFRSPAHAGNETMVARAIWRWTRSLEQALPAPKLPAGIATTCWQDATALQTHRLLESAYSAGGGSVEPYDEWFEWFTSDPEFDPESCFLAWQGNELAGVALCWTSAFVKDLCVAAPFRRRGLGSGLLSVVLTHFASRGAASLELRSHADNPNGANHLYRKMGFVELET